MTWTIHQEFHVSPAATYKGRETKPIDFHYAIRRSDGSLLFRTESPGFATYIVDALYVTHELPKAA